MLLTWKFRILRLKEQKKLNPRNSMVYKSIVKYIQNSTLTSYQKEEALQQIMDMILQAQIENKNINAFIGNDLEEFCDSIISEYNLNLSFIYKTLDFIQSYMILTFSILFIPLIIKGFFSGSSFDLSTSIDNFIIISIIVLCSLHLFRRDLQKNAFIAPLPLKYSISTNNYHGKGIFTYIILFFIYGISKNYLSNNFGIDLSSQYIYLFNNKLFLLILFIIVSSIQIYKNYFNRQKS
ncbi:DUF1048 domain-containing protein [Clostridium brassicae]|uniref:DUF1048 domain-containing protein n=1 Tax=Clostridium brassicae TaxID=2999072 RepID=A0ABT4D5L2_9CLOT|nr:DUF1048 domain-containing protein [Clostridium brassicae]MCY6957567.1 DUF1048 domain-containing protein [Clostridium brassicae]